MVWKRPCFGLKYPHKNIQWRLTYKCETLTTAHCSTAILPCTQLTKISSYTCNLKVVCHVLQNVDMLFMKCTDLTYSCFSAVT